MPSFEHEGSHIYYESHGEGFPVLAFAPGGMQSSIERWSRSIIKARELLERNFRVITLDQRNAGRSTAPITSEDGWHSYTKDHLALLDHLRIERCHLLGVCIGGAFSLSLIQAAPARVASAVLIQPIGDSGHNRSEFYALFDAWAAELPDERRPEPSALQAFRSRLYDGDFVFSVSRAFVRSCPVPLLVLLGNDVYHPPQVSREIVERAPNARLIEEWKEGAALREAERQIVAFLQEAS